MSNNPVAEPQSSSVEHDPAAAIDAEREMRGGATGIDDPDDSDADGDTRRDV